MGFSCDMASGIEGSVVQLVRMLPCHGRGRGFESRPVRLITINPLILKGFFNYFLEISIIHNLYSTVIILDVLESLPETII